MNDNKNYADYGKNCKNTLAALAEMKLIRRPPLRKTNPKASPCPLSLYPTIHSVADAVSLHSLHFFRKIPRSTPPTQP